MSRYEKIFLCGAMTVSISMALFAFAMAIGLATGLVVIVL
jgi:hypothetical protein